MCDNTLHLNKVLLIEPFYGGSHKQLIEFLTQMLKNRGVKYDLVTLPAKKWHWRARTSALFISKSIPQKHYYKVIFCSSVLNLAELIALRMDLSTAFKIIYFHENQFVYPKQSNKDRDFQYGYNTILSALVANRVVFNSHYNMDTFIGNISKHLHLQPDFQVKGIAEEVLPKCRVVYFPVSVDFRPIEKCYDILHIVWPHRWEHDKGPELFFETLFHLKEIGGNFKLSVLGESYVDPMPIFTRAQNVLKENILHFGRLESREDYLEVLRNAHVVVSTSNHEFFGVAMLEAVKCGCFPIAPHALVYPELYPSQYLYRTTKQLLKILCQLCKRPDLTQTRLQNTPIALDQVDTATITTQFEDLLKIS